MARVSVEQAVEKLKSGQVVALPTETVYGLAAGIHFPEALKNIFALKGRPFFDPLIVHVESVEQARGLAKEWPTIYDLLAKKFWPGPLTLIAKKVDTVSPVISSGLDTVALRCPSHEIIREVIHQAATPLAAPSANLFGRTSPTTAAHVESEFGGKVDVVDGGPCTVGVESTVLSAEQIGDLWRVKILRPGGISRAQLRSALSLAGVKFEIAREESVASPGHLKAHYQPQSPVIILHQTWTPAVHKEVEVRLRRQIASASELKLPPTPQEAARSLYENFRQLSSGPEHAIWVRRQAEHHGEDWEAVWDRIERASSIII